MEKEEAILIKIMQKYGVKVYNKQYYCASDLFKKFAPDVDYKTNVDGFFNKRIIDDEIYFNKDSCLTFLRIYHDKLWDKAIELMENKSVIIDLDDELSGNVDIEYKNKPVIYLAYVGFYESEHLFIYGSSPDILSKDFVPYRNIFSEFKIIFVQECDNYEQVKKIFVDRLRSFDLRRERLIRGGFIDELFTTNKKISIQLLVTDLTNIINYCHRIANGNNKTIADFHNVDKNQLELKQILS